MDTIIEIPEDYIEFLFWIKERIETLWSINPEESKCEKWIYGAKWIGLNELEIDTVEEKYGIKFSFEHRAFLKILHTIDRKQRVEYTERFEEDPEILVEERSFFYNWLEDDEEIRMRLCWPHDQILNDLLKYGGWLKSWGPKPENEMEKKKAFSELISKAPKLIPITGHRFSFDNCGLKDKPVLSVWGTDTIVYGSNFRFYLLNELEQYFDLFEEVYDVEDDYFYAIPNDILRKQQETDFENMQQLDVPFWSELIAHYNSTRKV